MTKRTFFIVAVSVAIGLSIRTFLFDGVFISSNSMYPTLDEGLHVFSNRASLLFRSPRRGEIVVFSTPQEPGKGLVKRVIAVGGDVVEIRDRKVFLNGEPLDEPYKIHLRDEFKLKGDTMDPIQVPDGFVFVLGDNRDYSKDSRDYLNEDGKWAPYVPVENIKGLISE